MVNDLLHFLCQQALTFRCAEKKKAQWRAHRAMWSYLMTKRAALICQLSWRQSIARKQLVKLRLVLPALLLETSTAHGFLVFAA